MSAFAVKHIAVLGGNVEAYCFAALLKTELGDAVDIQMEPSATQDIGPISALILEGQSEFHARLELDDADLLMHCDGQFGLGTLWRGWLGDDSEAMIAGSENLPHFNGVAFHQLMHRAAKARGEQQKMYDLLSVFQLPAAAAVTGKFTHPAADPQSPRSMLKHRLHVDARLYAKLLRSIAIEKGVTEVWGPEGDIVIDCRVSDEVDTAKPFDCMISAVLPLQNANLPYDSVTAGPETILWQIATAHGETATLLYNSSSLSHAEAKALLKTITDVDDIDCSPPMLIANKPIKASWSDVRIAVGPALGSFGPLQSLDMLVTHRAVIRLAALIPVSQDWSLERSEYNRLLSLDLLQADDIASLPLVLNKRTENIWRMVASCSQPNLALRIKQFESRGRIVTFDHELLSEQEWVDRFGAFGVRPARYDPLANLIDMSRTGQMFDKMADVFSKTVAQMPMLEAYRTKYLEAYTAHKKE